MSIKNLLVKRFLALTTVVHIRGKGRLSLSLHPSPPRVVCSGRQWENIIQLVAGSVIL